MPSFFIFLLKINIALIIFCMGYYAILRQLTFYTLNRVYLCIAIIFSPVYPLINNPLKRSPVQAVVNWSAHAEKLIQYPRYWYWAEVIFWVGAVLFGIRLLMQLASLYRLYKNSVPTNIQGLEVRIINANISPFSFWQSIYINPANLAETDLENVLQHEHIHVKEWHTLDILLTEVSVIFYWFNPGIWLMKKAVRENIEFITDRKILQQGIDSKQYQYSLLNVSFNTTAPAGIANHFNISTLKKRIQMMNTKRSSNINLTRYLFLMPAVIILLLIFSFSKAALIKKSNVSFRSAAILSMPKASLPSASKEKRHTIKKAQKPEKNFLPQAHNAIAFDNEPHEQEKKSTGVNAGSLPDKVRDLLKQLPGIQIDNDGNITAQNKPVKQIIVDGNEVAREEVLTHEIEKNKILDGSKNAKNDIEEFVNRVNTSLPPNQLLTQIKINEDVIYPRIVITTKKKDDNNAPKKALNFIMINTPVNLPKGKI